MVFAFLTRVHVSVLCIHYHCLQSDSVRRGSTTLSSNTIKLRLLEIFHKRPVAMQPSRAIITIIEINCPGKRTQRSGNVMESQFQCSVCTLHFSVPGSTSVVS